MKEASSKIGTNYTVSSNNTTILLNGSCNAECDFCFWDRNEAKIKAPENYFNKIFDSLKSINGLSNVLSISGGEPTLSKYFPKFLVMLSKFRREYQLNRVVLTTHAGNLLKHIDLVGSVVDHINISRHGIGDAENYNIFKTNNIPSDADLVYLIKEVHNRTLCDVTLNCVIKNDVSVDFCYKFIDYAKSLGADAVSFRKEASTVTPTEAELFFVETHGVISSNNCPVCRGVNQLVKGFDVRWKTSVNEPSIDLNSIYEYIIHPDGNLYADWNMRFLVSVSNNNSEKEYIPNKKDPVSIYVTNNYYETVSPKEKHAGSYSCSGGTSKPFCGG